MLQKIGAEWQGFSRPSGRPFRGRICAVDTQDIIGRLRENEAALRAQGVAHAALFGSRARGDNRPDSDIDIMVEIAPEAPVGVFEYVAITYAATRALEIISEAARRLPQALRDRHPELPWRAIMGAGNVYRHDYDNVAEEFVWRTLHEHVPVFLAVVADEIARLGDTP
ncbi:MAG: DUF86 domain-containing protein [Methylocystis sp.]|nr:DUF86 domain-containing protein [Methylocystis sp.]